MKRLLLCLIVLISFGITASAAAPDISVHVLDSKLGAIPGATVSLISRDGDRRTLTTDSNGSCRFAAILPGQYLIQGAAANFAPSEPKQVNLTDDGSVDLTIGLGLAPLQTTVVVTASGTPQTTDEVSKALTVIDGSTINLRADTSVGEALLDVPGFGVQQLGGPGSTTYFKVRGLRNTDTAVLVDGLRLRDAAGTQADASGVLQDMLITDTSRIEVLRGAGSSLYGTDAIGGVVNIVTDEGGGRTRGSMTLDGGSLGSIKAMGHLSGGLRHDSVQYSAGVTHWNVRNGLDDDSPAHDTSGQGQITWRPSSTTSLSGRIYAADSYSLVRLTPRSVGLLPPTGIIDASPLSLSEQHRYENGTPLAQLVLGSATFLTDTYNPDSTRVGRFFTGALRFSVRPSDRFGFTSQYQGLTTTRYYSDGPAGPGTQPKGISLSNYYGRIQTANARVDGSLGRFQRIDAGYEFEAEDFQNRLIPPVPATNFFTNVSQRSHSLFGQDQLRLADGRLQLSVAYRAQFFSLNPVHFEPLSGAPFSGQSFSAPPTAQTGDASTAYTVRQSGTKFRAHAGRSYRAPSLYERFGTFFSGSSYTLYGDPGLHPDRSGSIDGGVDQSFANSRIQVSATYFYTRLNEVIIFDSSAAITPLTDPLGRNGGYRNTHGGIARGIELSSTVTPTASLQVSGSYTYTDSRQSAPVVPGVWQTFEVPRHRFSLFATQRFSSKITGEFRYIGSTNYLASVSSRAFRFDGSSRVQTLASYRQPLSENKALRLYLKGDNLLNQAYFEKGYRTPGRTISSGVQLEF